ncbi:SMP-30/gluconolactonase/LRE family protein [Streptomyces sp. 8N706]|uniref:SMP-30/gluconolactonase/LRE family protein n=1 Tax=Streptomyces sp. 8N706 TaxID=3457416 RepID=UPI003FD66431
MPRVSHRRSLAALGLALATALSLAPAAPAAADAGSHHRIGHRHPFRTSTAHVLPGDRVYPEGIAADPYTGDLFVSSYTTGTIFRIAPGHRAAEVFLPAGTDGRTTAGGLKVDRAGRLWVADRGGVSVYDVRTRGLIARFDAPAQAEAWVNDLAIAPDGAAYVTDSRRELVYRVTPAQLRDAAETGGHGLLRPRFDLRAVEPHTADAYTLNGIVADPSGRYLLTVDMTGGDLYRLDTASGAIRKVALHGADLTHADGLELRHGTLWAAHNAGNTISRWRMSEDGTAARVVRQVTDASLQTPTTLVRRDGRIFVVRSQFDKGGPMGPGMPETPFTVAAVDGI